jgi:hypothetical protein
VIQEIGAPRFHDRHMEVVSLLNTTHRSPSASNNIPGIPFRWRLSRPQSHSAAGMIMSMKNSSDTIGNQTRNLRACGAVPKPTTPLHVSNESNLKTSEIVTAPCWLCFHISFRNSYTNLYIFLCSNGSLSAELQVSQCF